MPFGCSCCRSQTGRSGEETLIKKGEYMLLKDLMRVKHVSSTDELSAANERRQKIIDYIRSKPAGTIITYTDFMEATGSESYGTIGSTIKSMLHNDMIRRYGEAGGYTYAVVEDASTVAIVNKLKPANKPKKAKKNTVKAKVIPEPKPTDIEALAMKYGWENPDRNNDLRAFVAWHKEQK
jgi:hypothetical protein